MLLDFVSLLCSLIPIPGYDLTEGLGMRLCTCICIYS